MEVTVASHSFERNLNGDGNGQQQAQDGKRRKTGKIRADSMALEEGAEEEASEEEVLLGAEGSTVSFTA